MKIKKRLIDLTNDEKEMICHKYQVKYKDKCENNCSYCPLYVAQPYFPKIITCKIKGYYIIRHPDEEIEFEDNNNED